MKKLILGIVAASVLGAALITAASLVPQVRASGEWRMKSARAPFPPGFVKYLNARKEGKSLVTYTKDGHALGLLPGPIDFSHLKNAPDESAPQSFPATYDLRTKNKQTPVKDQGNCGSCWAFANYGSLESFLKPGAAWDFSEEDLIEKHGLDVGPCDGGTLAMALAYLCRWGGPVQETQHPYEYAAGDGTAPSLHVQNVVYIPEKANPLDNNKLKNAVMKYGAVMVGMCWNDMSYGANAAYYYNGTADVGGHAVDIVGWDDNYPKSKFRTPKPPGNGAFIVKNSWGTGFGMSGFFYVSYYDSFFAKRGPNAVLKGEPASNYSKVYQYDPLGMTNAWRFGDAGRGWLANIFTAREDGRLQAVGFYANGTSNPYEIYVHVNVASGKPGSGVRMSVTKGTLQAAGYYTIVLPEPVAVEKGHKFSIIVKLTTRNYDWWAPVETYWSDYSTGADSKPGQSFVGSGETTWTDITSYGGDLLKANVCLKGYMKR